MKKAASLQCEAASIEKRRGYSNLSTLGASTNATDWAEELSVFLRADKHVAGPLAGQDVFGVGRICLQLAP